MEVMNMKMKVILLFLLLIRVETEALSYNFYKESCPQVENIVRTGIRSASFIDASTPSALLRLLFHDCQVQGCDASILLDPDYVNTYYSEMAAKKNFGIRKRELINKIKSDIEAICPSVVSCSDIVVMAARDAVALSGGPRISVPLGRRDSLNPPDFKSPDALLPPANIAVDDMLYLFSKKGLNIEESVAILGSHTLGITHCLNLQNRIYNSINIGVRLICPLGSLAPRTTFVPNDRTPTIFDNQYYINAINGRGLLNIDAQMPFDARTAPYVNKFANNQDAFFRAFSSAFVKLTTSRILTGNQGNIRKTCNQLN